MNRDEWPAILEFESPVADDQRGWEDALARCCGFPDQFLQKARESADWRERAGQYRLQQAQIIRNLISVLDNCHDAQAAREGEAAPADVAAETLCLASVQRSLVSLLEYLGVVSVELLGKTYETVEHEGTQIEDPFEILESHGSGAVRSQPVLEVVSPLWIQREGKKIRILRPGKGLC